MKAMIEQKTGDRSNAKNPNSNCTTNTIIN